MSIQPISSWRQAVTSHRPHMDASRKQKVKSSQWHQRNCREIEYDWKIPDGLHCTTVGYFCGPLQFTAIRTVNYKITVLLHENHQLVFHTGEYSNRRHVTQVLCSRSHSRTAHGFLTNEDCTKLNSNSDIAFYVSKNNGLDLKSRGQGRTRMKCLSIWNEVFVL